MIEQLEMTFSLLPQTIMPKDHKWHVNYYAVIVMSLFSSISTGITTSIAINKRMSMMA